MVEDILHWYRYIIPTVLWPLHTEELTLGKELTPRYFIVSTALAHVDTLL